MRRTPIHASLILAATVAALTGCSNLPTAPRTEATLAPGSAPVVIGQADDPSPPQNGGIDGSITTITLSPGNAASLHTGRFTLFIHKNSLKMPATITISQPDPNVMAVHFTVSPPEANNFQVPMRLIADCSQDTPEVFQNETIFWWNGGWKPTNNARIDKKAQTIEDATKKLVNAMLGPK